MTGLLAAAAATTAMLVHDDVVLRGEPFAAGPDFVRQSAGSGETLASALFKARAEAVVAVNAEDGQGTGSIIRPDGWVLTCAHVLGRASRVQVVLHGGETREAAVVVADPVIDLALLKIDAPSPLPWIALADLSELGVGDPVVSIGHPKGFGWTVNTGIVSNLYVFRDGRRDPGVIQTQVPLNPGNSGGPLLDRHGRLVGVIAQGDPGAQSLNWSISARAVKEFLVRHAWELPHAQLTVTAAPAGAEIFLDGELIGQAPRATGWAKAGTHVIEVRKPGLGNVFAPFLVLQRETVELDVRLAPAGSLAVTSDVDGVDVYVDGVLRGQTPLVLDIAAGPHVVSGSKSGTADTMARVTVAAGDETEILLSHPSNAAFLSVSSDPAGAEVIVDGESFGPTPVDSRALPPGQHVVDIRVGDSARRVVIDVAPEVHRKLEFDLRPPVAIAIPTPVGMPSAVAAPTSRVRADRTWKRAVALSIAGAAVGSLSAAILATEDDDALRAGAAIGLVGGAATFSAGPMLLIRDSAPGLRAESEPENGPVIGAGVSGRF